MTKDEALRMALRSIKELVIDESDDAPALQGVRMRKEKAITAIREVLAQPEQSVDWEKLYRLEVKKKEALAAKYERDIKPLTKIVPMAQPERPAVQGEPFGHVTVRRLSQRFENHHDQYRFFPAGQSPYTDNIDECHAVYTTPQPAVPERKPWVGLTDMEREWLRSEADEADAGYTQLIKETEAKLREKNA